MIEIFITHLLANKKDKTSNNEKDVRKSQTNQLMEQVDESTADAVIVGGSYDSHTKFFTT